MTGLPYYGGLSRLGATIGGETINLTDDDIYLALMGSEYVQDVRLKADGGHEHWSDIVAYEIEETGDYVSGGQQLIITEVEVYIEAALFDPFAYLVYTANAGSTPIAYSVPWTGQTFTDLAGAVVYKKGVEVDGSDWPLFTFIVPPADKRNAASDKYFVEFGTPGETLGFFCELAGISLPE